MRHHIPCLLAIASMGAAALARWPDDPTQNLLIADRPDMQTSPRICCTSDGGCYIGFFDKHDGDWDVYLQRLDPAGNEMWPHNGVLVADRTCTWIANFSLAVDGEDNALLAFRDDRSGLDQITATRIAGDGSPLWGPLGVQLTHGTGFEYTSPPRIAATSEGDIVVAWSWEADLMLQKLDADGAPHWGEGVKIAPPPGMYYGLADLHASDDGAVIVSWVRSSTDCAPRHLYAQKLDAAGEAMWNTARSREAGGIVIFDGGSLQVADYPPFIPDGSGGAVFAWKSVTPVLQVHAQHIFGDGAEAFGHNGTAGSTAPRHRCEPHVCFNTGTGQTFLFWVEHAFGQSYDGIYGQRFDSHGMRQWTDSGLAVVHCDESDRGPVRTLACGDGALVFWADWPQTGPTFLRGARLSHEGELLWSPPVIDASTNDSSKHRLEAAINCHDMALLAWGGGDVYAQNVRADGTLGLRAGDVNGDGAVDVDDLLLLLADWGCTGAGCVGDLNGDGDTNTADLLLLLADWG
jgi:hypothetical protein